MSPTSAGADPREHEHRHPLLWPLDHPRGSRTGSFSGGRHDIATDGAGAPQRGHVARRDAVSAGGQHCTQYGQIAIDNVDPRALATADMGRTGVVRGLVFKGSGCAIQLSMREHSRSLPPGAILS